MLPGMGSESRRAFVQTVVTVGAIAVTPLVAAAPGLAPTVSCRSDLVEKTRALLDSLKDRVVDNFLVDWPVTQARRSVVPTSLPVLRWLPEVQAHAPAFSTSLISELYRAASCRAWRQTYKVPDVDAEFLTNYGWTELVGLTGELASTRIACGFLLLGPATHYPRHRHEAEEIYVPLAGIAAWQHGNGPWQEQSPGTVIHHASEEPHAMRTGNQPLLAVYLWRSANLNQKSQLDPTGARSLSD
jgi:Dimethlysulfonioproprionate lyase